MNALRRSYPWLALASLALAAVMLSGCATSRNVDSEVRSFGGTTPIATGATYRFERLPSQDPKAQEPLEAATQKALATKGLVLDEARARYTVQVRLDSDYLLRDAFGHWQYSPFDRIILSPDGTLWRQMRSPLIDPVWYRRTLQVVVRELGSGNIAYETRAVHDSPWSDTPNLIAPILDAALGDFPQSQPTPKTVTVVLPRPADDKP